VDVEIEKPHVHHPTGHRRFDLILPIAALFVSFLSILIAWHHGEVMKELVHQNEKLVEANSLPYLQISGSNGNGQVSFDAINEGVGPAKIATAELLVNNRPVEHLSQLIEACCSGRGDYSKIENSSLMGRMVRPGDVVHYIVLPMTPTNAPAFAALERARRSDQIVTKLCYCSVFDDCWMADSRDPTPDPVQQCPMPQHPFKD
jgi:hypothetical protein